MHGETAKGTFLLSLPILLVGTHQVDTQGVVPWNCFQFLGRQCPMLGPFLGFLSLHVSVAGFVTVHNMWGSQANRASHSVDGWTTPGEFLGGNRGKCGAI